MAKNARIYILISTFLGLLILLTIVYLVGLARGRGDVQSAVATAQAQSFLARIVATDTPTATPTPSNTPTVTPTPTLTPTPTATPTSSPTPASPEEWAQRFLDLGTSGLNAIAGWEFTSARAESLLRSAAQQQSLVFAPVAYTLLSEDPWAALVVPHTPDGKSLPMLFWQDPNDGNHMRSQLLTGLFAEQGIGNYDALRMGIEQGTFAADTQGRFYALLIERVEGDAERSVWLLAQEAAAGDFAFVWSTRDDPSWPVSAAGSTVLMDPQEDSFLPDLVVDAPLPPTGSLRQIVRAPGTFVEQDPYARQWTNTRWSPLPAAEDGSPQGYQLAGAGLRSTPLTSMAQIISLLQSGRLDSALNYATRLDLVQQAFGFGLAQPGWWIGLYLNDAGEPAEQWVITPRLRFFDNGDRARTYDATFELDDSGFYRLAAIQQVAAIETSFVTPSSPLPTLTPTQEATATPQGAQTAVATNTPLPTPLPVGEPTNTPEASATFTPAPSRSPTSTPTATETPTPTETATALPTDTPTSTPLPIPEIPEGAAAPLAGVTNVLEPARLRGGPGTDYPVLLPVDNGLAVGVFGITEAGDWLLIRVDELGHPNNGFAGWMFRDLVSLQGDAAVLPVYGADGIALTPVALPADTGAEGAAPLLPTSTPTPVPSPTATPLVTPEVRQPEVSDPPAASVPPPEVREFMATIAGDQIPANPLAPIPAIAADGREFVLHVETAAVELWGGIVGYAEAQWMPVAGELLWPGAVVYIEVRSGGLDAGTVTAGRVRIVGGEERQRVTLEDGSGFANAASSANSVGLVGGAGAGISVLDTEGAVKALWQDAARVDWLDAGDAGVVAMLKAEPYGRQGFLWARSDGASMRIYAQPYFTVQGIAGDPYTGVWWIETPLFATGRWQLWQWEPQSGRVLLRLEAGDDLFAQAQQEGETLDAHLLPTLLAIQPVTAGDPAHVELYVTTTGTYSFAPNRGIFRMEIAGAIGESAQVVGAPRLLVAPDAYQEPLTLSPDHSMLALLAYDSDQPSLTGGAVTPANRLKVLKLSGEGAGSLYTLYQTETALEFLAPTLAWQDDGTLLATRARFAATGVNQIDMFGAVWLEVEQDAGGRVSTSAISVRIPAGRELLDISGCRLEQSALLVLLSNDGSLNYARWASIEPIALTFTVPNNLKQIFTCWRNPPGRGE